MWIREIFEIVIWSHKRWRRRCRGRRLGGPSGGEKRERGRSWGRIITIHDYSVHRTGYLAIRGRGRTWAKYPDTWAETRYSHYSCLPTMPEALRLLKLDQYLRIISLAAKSCRSRGAVMSGGFPAFDTRLASWYCTRDSGIVTLKIS